MNQELIEKLKKDIINAGKLLWDKNLATGLNGNISARLDNDIILLTGHKTCLGFLKEEDIVLVGLKGNILDGAKASSERLMHTEIYKAFPKVKVIVHSHTSYTNGYFSAKETLVPSTFETKLYLGEIKSVAQSTPSVTDVSPVIDALKNNNIMVLRNHGVVVMGDNFFDCFLLVQALEEAVKVDLIRNIYTGKNKGTSDAMTKTDEPKNAVKKYRLFCEEHINEIVKLVNSDAQLKELGEKMQMTMDLAVKLDGSPDVYSFKFENGHIQKVGHDENAEFLISAPEDVWKAVFNREIDPFVATTQKKMNLRGDFAKISRWYAPCSRIFELWQQVPVE